MADPGDPARDNGPQDKATDSLPFCALPVEGLDADGCVSSEFLRKLDLSGCQLRPDTCFALEPADAPAPMPKAFAPVFKKLVKKVVKKAVKHKEIHMEERNAVPAPNEAASEPIVPVPAPMRATVGIPDNALGDIQKLLPADGNASMITVLLAVVGVAGGGAAFKFYRSWQKSRHEQEMKRLEIEEKKAEKQDTSHQPCEAARTALETRVTALEGQLATAVADLEQKIAEARQERAQMPQNMAAFDPEELEARMDKADARLKKLEKAIKPPPAKSSKR